MLKKYYLEKYIKFIYLIFTLTITIIIIYVFKIEYLWFIINFKYAIKISGLKLPEIFIAYLKLTYIITIYINLIYIFINIKNIIYKYIYKLYFFIILDYFKFILLTYILLTYISYKIILPSSWEFFYTYEQTNITIYTIKNNLNINNLVNYFKNILNLNIFILIIIKIKIFNNISRSKLTNNHIINIITIILIIITLPPNIKIEIFLIILTLLFDILLKISNIKLKTINFYSKTPNETRTHNT